MAGKQFGKQQLNAALIKIVALLHSYNITMWFIGYGTLLGIVRGKSCIDQDDDIDIIINSEHIVALRNLITQNRFKYIVNKKNIIKVEVNGPNEPTVDFYLALVDAGGNFNDTWEKTTWTNCYDLIPCNWNGVNLQLPNNYETKLQNRYGDWKVPQKSKGVVPKKTSI